ncbi:MAG: Wzz/FepE/Etk N-terminal domain-containing protein [Anaerolineae bacterium]|nr:Wzz/FepE/Etk N-terminal domain-containing protein [Anaerolineae bacterium]
MSNTAQTSPDTPAPNLSPDEIVIDFGKIIAHILRFWRLLLACALLGGLIGFAYTRLFPTPYEATATIALVKTRTDIEFDPKFKTVSQDSLGGAAPSALDSRRASLVGLVQNGVIAQTVVNKLGDKLDIADRNPARLLQKVKGEAPTRTDLVSIKVQDQNPALAAAIANAWALEYEQYVNTIYGGAPVDLSQTIKVEYQRAVQEYEAAQSTYEKFIANSKYDEYYRVISETQQTLDALQRSRQTALLASLESEQKWRQTVLDAYRDAQAQNRVIAFVNEQDGKRAVIHEQAQARLKLLNTYSTARVKSLEWLNQARSMRQQISSGGDAAAATNYFALLSLKAQVYGTTLPTLQFSSQPATTATSQLADLDALINSLNAQIGNYEQLIKSLATDLGNGKLDNSSPITLSASTFTSTYANLFELGDTAKLGIGIPTTNSLALAALEQSKALAQLRNSLVGNSVVADESISALLATMRENQAKLEQEIAQRTRLVQARDVARDTYSTLSRKLAEVSIAAAVNNTEVKFAAPALAPVSRISAQNNYLLIATFLGLAIGLILMLILRFKQDSLLKFF